MPTESDPAGMSPAYLIAPLQPETTQHSPPWLRRLQRPLVGEGDTPGFLGTMLLPSHCLRGPQIPLGHLRLSKLLAVCLLELLLTRTVVVIFAMEHDGRYGVAEFVRYDSQQVLLDLIALFVLGEFWRQPGVDTLFFVAVSTAGALANSVLNELSSALQVR